MPAHRRHFLAISFLTLALIVALPIAREVRRRMEKTPAPAGPAMPRLGEGRAWLGAPPGDAEPGTLMVIAVFSATDPRALDLLPAVEAWHEAYHRKGVRVVGLHRPQFAFGADTLSLSHALRRSGVTFAVAHDPALEVEIPAGLPPTCALIGEAGGHVAIVSAGDRDLIEADRWLRGRITGTAAHEELPHASEAMAVPGELVRMMRLGAGQVSEGPIAGATPGTTGTFITQTRREEDGRPWVPVPVGRWTPAGEGLVAAHGGAANFLAIRYDAARVGVVASPPGSATRLWVLRDDQWVPPDRRGRDVKADATGGTYVEVDEPRLLILVEKDAGSHALKLSPEMPGVTLHALTFDR